MVSTLNPSEEGQLAQTIEMFEVITQSQPHDFQSLEILKEAYAKLGREKDVMGTAKRIAQAYVQMGQLSSAILEYETILQRYPDDPDVQEALKEIESKANSFPFEEATPEATSPPKQTGAAPKPSGAPASAAIDDGRRLAHKIFVEGKVISSGDFDLCWTTPDHASAATNVSSPFIQVLADKGILPVEESLKLLLDKSRLGFIPLPLYDIDLDLTRTFPAAICRRWCVMPFDRMSTSILVATANPFNQQAVKELSAATSSRLLWYLVSPSELVKYLRKAFR